MRATAEARPNIALVKYWGKSDIERNLPASGSLSITLDSLYTRMSVSLDRLLESDTLEVNGVPAPVMLPRVSRCLDTVLGPGRPAAQVLSASNFPIAAGLASSASSFAALVVAASEAAGLQSDTQTLARAAGYASGSAARSLFGGFVRLDLVEDAIQVATVLAAGQWPLEVIVGITEEAVKPMSSGDAMQLSAETSPFYRSWLAQQDGDLENAHSAVIGRDFAALARVAECNCLKMHSVMWASRPPVVYWNPATVSCLETLRVLQREGLQVFFTIDAGPQVKAVATADAADRVETALRNTAGVIRTLRSAIGPGAGLVAGA